MADPELLGLVDLALVGALGPRRHRRIAAHVRLDHTLGQPVRGKDGFVQQILHFYLHVEDEFAAIEELAQGGFRVEFPGDVYIDLLRDLLKLHDPVFFYQSIGRWSIQCIVILISGCNGERIFAVLEDQPYDIVYRVDRLVYPMILDRVDKVAPLMVYVHFLLARLFPTGLFTPVGTTPALLRLLPLNSILVILGAECRGGGRLGAQRSVRLAWLHGLLRRSIVGVVLDNLGADALAASANLHA